jgi:hypothetical protein
MGEIALAEYFATQSKVAAMWRTVTVFRAGD